MRKLRSKDVFRILNNYIVFFLLVAFTVTCCMMLFISTLAGSMGIVFTEENIGQAAKLTFGNVILITAIFVAIDALRRKYAVERPVRIITQAAEKIMAGDFTVRIPHVRDLSGKEGFNRIIDAINAMAEELSGTETLRTDFIANVSHELKTPLAVMGNYAAILRQPGVSQEEKDACAEAIGEASKNLANLITNILKLNKLENQQIPLQKQAFDLAEQLRENLLQFEDAWEQKDLEIETALPDTLSVYSDPELLSLVWNNLISNAVKFTPQGGTVGIRLEEGEQTVAVTVYDTGCGMTSQVGRHIFEKFYQADTSRATRGNGLGLALVKRVVEILGARISVKSAAGEGSSFTVEIRRDGHGL